MSVQRKITSAALTLTLIVLAIYVVVTANAFSGPVISGTNVPLISDTSVLINFQTDIPAYAHIDYGLTTGYGQSTLVDSARFYKEHAIQLTGLTANTSWHYRIVATGGGATTTGSDQVLATATTGSPVPAMPVEVDSRMPDMTGATEKTVKTSGGDYTPGQFQTALNDAGTANEKRIITVDAGLTVSGTFSAPGNSDSNWIVVRTSAFALLPEGARVSPASTANMFKIQTSTLDPALVSAAGANHIRFIGAEITIDPSVIGDAPAGQSQSGIVNFTFTYNGVAINLPKFIGFDRCYIHGQPTKNTRRGVYMIGEDVFIIDSYLDEFHDTGFDAQAVLFTDVKRGRILNCTLIGSGENFMWGGAGLSTSGYVIGDMEYLRNFQYHPVSWKNNGPSYAGIRWITKNLFECKTCARVLMFGNYFGGVTPSQGGFWPDAQSLAINLKLEQNSIGPGTCDLMQDLTLYKNWGRNLAAGLAIVGRTNSAQGCTNRPDRVWIGQNIWEFDATTWTPATGATSGSWNASGGNWGGTDHLQISHNSFVNANPTQTTTCGSVFSDGTIAIIADPVTPKFAAFIMRDNYFDFRACGLSGSGNLLNATGALDGQFSSYTVTNNGLLRTAGVAGNFPIGQVFATSWAAQLVNFNGGISGDYRVAPGSSWKNAASDGADIGADFSAAQRASENTPTGLWPGTPVTTSGGLTVSGKTVLSGKVVSQ